MPRAYAFLISVLLAQSVRSEPWWHVPTPVVTQPQTVDVVAAGGGAVRGAGYPSGWYGFWYIDDQERTGQSRRTFERAGKSGVKRVVYFDAGEVGDYAGFFTDDGKMVYNGWSIPWWKGERVSARWFGLEAFMGDVPWAPWPTAKAYGLRPFTLPDGRPIEGNLYEALAHRGLDARWEFDFFSNEKVTDELAAKTGLDKISSRQTGRDDVRGKSGWRTTRLVHTDLTNPQLRDYRCAELSRMIERIRPEGVHIDNHGDVHILYPSRAAFGPWAVHQFRGWLKAHATPDRLRELGVGNPDTFDFRLHMISKMAEASEKPAQRAAKLRDPSWTEDPLWLGFLMSHVDASLDYHRAIYRASKEAGAKAGLDLLVCGNVVPFFPGRASMRGACDIAHFECRSEGRYGPYRASGLPPWGRIGGVTRLGAAISGAGYCWPSQYVSKGLAGPGHENLHKALEFDALANRGLMDFGHWYLDGYSPGTDASAGHINSFVKKHAGLLKGRRYVADVGIVYCGWSEVASITPTMPITARYADEYFGWTAFLDHQHFQWDIILADGMAKEDLSRFPVVVLPSISVISDSQARVLEDYVRGGGRLVATGLSGTRHGTEGWLMPRTKNALETLKANARVRIEGTLPGADYWNKERDSNAANQMTGLLALEPAARRIESDAPATVSVQMNMLANGKSLAIDLTNFDVDPATDARRPAAPCQATIKLPEPLTARGLVAKGIAPGGDGSREVAIAAPTTHGPDSAVLKIPSFDDFMIVVVEAR